MAGTGPLSIDVQGLDEAERDLARLISFMLDLRWLWPSVANLFVSWIRRQFETEGALLGDPWEPLTPGYLALKTRLWPGKGILVAEGDLYKAATQPERIQRAHELTLRITDPKLQYHQKGTTRMPARPLIPQGLGVVVQLELREVIERETDDLVRRLGLQS